MKYVKIPNEIKLGGQVLNVKRVERCDDNSVGEVCLPAGYIEIAEKFNKGNHTKSNHATIGTFLESSSGCPARRYRRNKLNP